jgi:uncharacterized protein YndB with AHSA1/START domain
MATSELSHTFVVYIRSSLEHVWRALTESKLTQKYFFGATVTTDWKPGSSIVYTAPDGEGGTRVAVEGEIIECTPMTRLSYTFTFPRFNEEHSRVTYELEEMEGMVKLTLSHDKFPEESKIYHEVQKGWPWLFSAMKSLLETGEILPQPKEWK